MAVCNNQINLESIKKLIKEKTYHPFLNKNIKPPYIEDDHILLLSYPLIESGVPKDEGEAYIAAAILATYALDIHENVTNNIFSTKEKQLAVLAGDYYSGMYYRLLAEYQNMELIKNLADAIKSVNEHKIYLDSKQQDAKQYLETIKTIESSIPVEFCKHFLHFPAFSDLIEEYYFLKRIIQECLVVMNGKQSPMMAGFRECVVDKDRHTSQIVKKCITAVKPSVEKIKKMELTTLPEELQKIVQDLIRQMDQLTAQWVEEYE